jgi:hypothetical protein
LFSGLVPLGPQVSWVGSSSSSAGRQLYRTAQVGSHKVQPGTIILLEADETERQAEAAAAAAAGAAARPKQQHELYVFGLVQCMWEDEEGEKMAQVGAAFGLSYAALSLLEAFIFVDLLFSDASADNAPHTNSHQMVDAAAPSGCPGNWWAPMVTHAVLSFAILLRCSLYWCAMQVRLLVPGAETVLGDAAADAELFVTDEYDEVRHTHNVTVNRIAMV